MERFFYGERVTTPEGFTLATTDERHWGYSDCLMSFLTPPVRARLAACMRSSPAIRGVEGRFVAERLGATSKRLDICAAQFASALQVSGIRSLHDAVCMEVGTGWVLTHSVIMHLLGARKVFATDIKPVAQPAALSVAIAGAIASVVHDLLSPFENRGRVRARLDRLRRIKRFDFETLNALGIEYKAPIDLAKERMRTPIDFVYSNAVLEHVPSEDLGPMLGYLAEDLTPGGSMIHAVHLEDHRDFANDPFRFLQEPAYVFTREVQTSRGNRLRRSGWKDILSGLEGLDYRFLWEWTRDDCPLPERIDGSIRYDDETDLRVSHLGILLSKTR